MLFASSAIYPEPTNFWVMPGTSFDLREGVIG
jgi:hypothetical protein